MKVESNVNIEEYKKKGLDRRKRRSKFYTYIDDVKNGNVENYLLNFDEEKEYKSAYINIKSLVRKYEEEYKNIKVSGIADNEKYCVLIYKEDDNNTVAENEKPAKPRSARKPRTKKATDNEK